MMEDTSVLMPLKKLCDSLCKLGYSEDPNRPWFHPRPRLLQRPDIQRLFLCYSLSFGWRGQIRRTPGKGRNGEASGFALNIKELADHCIDGSPSPKIMLWCGCSDPADGLRYADGLYKKGISFELSWTADKE